MTAHDRGRSAVTDAPTPAGDTLCIESIVSVNQGADGTIWVDVEMLTKRQRAVITYRLARRPLLSWKLEHSHEPLPSTLPHFVVCSVFHASSKLKSLSSSTVFCSSIARLWIESTPRPKWNPRRSSSVRSMRSELRQVTGILRYELTDYKWAAVGPLLPTRPDGVARMR